MSPAKKKSEEVQKGKAPRFPDWAWNVLEELIKTVEGGKYFPIIRDRSASTCMVKSDAWTAIAKAFNEVRYPYRNRYICKHIFL